MSYSSAKPVSRLVDTAESYPNPVKPIRIMIYLIALSAGILLTVILVLLKKQFNDKILSADEIKQATDAPVIAKMVQNTSGETIVLKDGKSSVLAEQFRGLRTSLSFIGSTREDKKVILITSGISGEGKSFIAINLAASLSLTGKRVALVRFDLRSPPCIPNYI